MDWNAVRGTYYDALKDAGLGPQFDSDGDILMKREGMYLYLMKSSSDSYIQFLCPAFLTIGNEDELRIALVAASNVNGKIKSAKIYADQDLKHMSASCEFFISDPADLRPLVPKCIGCIEVALETFVDEAREVARR